MNYCIAKVIFRGLPANGNFYPDFVVELIDGRILIVEHKGEVYAANDDSKEKCSFGTLWEEKSSGKGLYLMAVMDKNPTSLYEQINLKMNA